MRPAIGPLVCARRVPSVVVFQFVKDHARCYGVFFGFAPVSGPDITVIWFTTKVAGPIHRRIKPGQVSDVLVSQTDLFATFAAILGEDLPKGASPDSTNILPALMGGQLPHPERPVVMSSGGTGMLSIRSGKWKLMPGPGDCGYREFFGKKPHPAPKPGDPPAQLYDVVADPGEQNNLYTKHPEIVHALWLTLRKIKSEEGYKPVKLEQPGKALTMEELNALFKRGKR